MSGGPRRQLRVELVLSGATPRCGGKIWVGGPRRSSRGVDERCPLGVVLAGQRQPPLAVPPGPRRMTGVHAVGHEALVAVAVTGGHPSVHFVIEELGAEELQRHLELRHVEVLTFAAAPTMV